MFQACQELGDLSSFPCLPPTTPLTVLHIVGTVAPQIVQHGVTQNAANFLTFDLYFAKKQF